jgi:hypothetical protein
MYKQRLHVKIILKKFLNSIKLFLLFSTEISSTEISHMFSTKMSRSRDVLIPFCLTILRVTLSSSLTKLLCPTYSKSMIVNTLGGICIVHVKIAKSLEKLRWRLLVCED